MYGDFSRDAFHPDPHYTRVLLQQGRPLTDADWNEQASILIGQHRQFIAQMMNWHGTFDDGFALRQIQERWKLAQGNYYVSGLRCTASAEKDVSHLLPNGRHALYLETWDESVSPIEEPAMLEPALNGIDTSWRARVRWNVRLLPDVPISASPANELEFARLVQNPYDDKRTLTVRRVATRSADSSGPCEVRDGALPGSGDLYRVEIHRGGRPLNPSDLNGVNFATLCTFKWSVENGTAVYPLSESLQQIASDGFRSREPLANGSRLELLDENGWSVQSDEMLLAAAPTALTSGVSFTPNVSRTAEPPGRPLLASSVPFDPGARLFLRRWDHHGPSIGDAPGGLSLQTRFGEHTLQQHIMRRQMVLANDGGALAIGGQLNGEDVWLELQPGLQVRFSAATTYVSGDYWLIRVHVDGSIAVNAQEGIDTQDGSETQDINSARRIHYAPLASIAISDGTSVDLRRRFSPTPVQSSPPGAPTPVPVPPPMPVEAPPGPTAAISPRSILSAAGLAELRRHVTLPQDILRRIPARCLNFAPQSATFQRWMATALVSELAGQEPGRLLDRIARIPQAAEEWWAVEQDVRTAIQRADQFSTMLASGDWMQRLLA